MKSTDLLLDDHEHIRRVLEIIEEMAVRAKHGQRPDPVDLKDLMEFLVGFGDRIHQGREEAFLFPALRENLKQGSSPDLSGLLFDHERQHYLIQGLQESAMTANSRDLVFCANCLAAVLRKHLDEEEKILFPHADATLSRAADQRIAAAMEAYDKHWQNTRLSPLLRRLDDLEEKYLGTTHAKVRALRPASRQRNRKRTAPIEQGRR